MVSKVQAPDPDADDVVWVPSEERVEEANVTAFMEEHGIASLEELINRSREDLEWFWGAVEEHLGVEWFEEYDAVLDASEGIEHAEWFTSGTTNIAHNCVDRWARGERSDEVALIGEAEDGSVREWTYQDLYETTNQVAGALEDAGVSEGDAVGVFMPMIPETVAATMAIAKLGAIFVPLFSGFAPDAIATRLADADAKALITADGFARGGSRVEMKSTADEALAEVPTVEDVIVYDNADLDVPMDADRDRTWAEATAGQPTDKDSVPVDSEHPWMVVYTSGTTGKPKGAVHVHGGFLVKIMQEVAHQTDVGPEDVLYWITDMGWIMGPWEVVGGLGLGASVVLYEGSPTHPDPGRVWQLVEDHEVDALGLSPTFVRAIIPEGDEHVTSRDLSSLKAIGSTGEPWNPEPYRWLLDTVGDGDVPIINLSGGTEVGACFLSPLPITPLKPCTLGHPSLGVATDVLDDDANPVRDGEVGELACTRSWPGMTRGLWQAPDRYEEAYWDRWPEIWAHGDWASVDEDGYWYLHGRSDDVITVAGKRVGPAEVESAAVDTGLAQEAAAVGVPHDVKGQSVHVFAIPTNVDDEHEARQRISQAVVDGLGKPFKPGGVHFVDDLPRTKTAKILRRAIEAKAKGEDPGDLSSIDNPEALDLIEAVD
ncbi:AMP-dependent synthetase [Thermoplasmatales archaeon SW_10_69_26]|nr:MAG: AMP-dependent synthetase [Thermoplasmatales archaeon SW_10_69_26]